MNGKVTFEGAHRLAPWDACHSSSLIGSRALSQLHPDSIGIMWLLNSHGSNPMKHLIPSLQDDQKAADYLRQVRWPDGVTCPRGGSDAVESRERYDNGVQRFSCVPCAARLAQQFAMFTDWIFVDCSPEPFPLQSVTPNAPVRGFVQRT